MTNESQNSQGADQRNSNRVSPEVVRAAAPAISIVARTALTATYWLIAVGVASAVLWVVFMFFVPSAFSGDGGLIDNGTGFGDLVRRVVLGSASIGEINGYALIVIGLALSAVGGDVNGKATHRVAIAVGAAGIVLYLLLSPYVHYLQGY